MAPHCSRFQFFLYTPGVAIDEIPLENSVRVAEVLENPAESSLPIASDAFSRLVQKHQLYRISALEDRGHWQGDGKGTLEAFQRHKPQWYESWQLWAVVGGVLGGIFVAHLAGKKPAIGSRSN